jgi:hypothetical protein
VNLSDNRNFSRIWIFYYLILFPYKNHYFIKKGWNIIFYLINLIITFI